MRTDSNIKIEFLTPQELADTLKISKAGVYRLIEKRAMPFIKIMGSIRFDRQDILDYLQKQRVESVGN